MSPKADKKPNAPPSELPPQFGSPAESSPRSIISPQKEEGASSDLISLITSFRVFAGLSTVEAAGAAAA